MRFFKKGKKAKWHIETQARGLEKAAEITEGGLGESACWMIWGGLSIMSSEMLETSAHCRGASHWHQYTQLKVTHVREWHTLDDSNAALVRVEASVGIFISQFMQ